MVTYHYKVARSMGSNHVFQEKNPKIIEQHEKCTTLNSIIGRPFFHAVYGVKLLLTPKLRQKIIKDLILSFLFLFVCLFQFEVFTFTFVLTSLLCLLIMTYFQTLFYLVHLFFFSKMFISYVYLLTKIC